MLPRKIKKKWFRVLFCIAIVLIVFTIIFYKIDKDIRPVLSAVSNSEVRILATEAINKIVKEELSDNIKYSDFVSIKTDKNGDISAIEMNTIEMNKFGAKVALRVQEEMEFIGGRGVSIPLGVITNSSLLSYYGPKINVKVMPLGNVTTDFKSELQSAGINQCRYRVYISVSTNAQIMVPFGEEKVNVVSTIPIAETLIVGKVPSSYFSNESGGMNVPNVVPIPVPENN